MTHWRRPCWEEDECLMMRPRAWCAAFKASVEFSFSLSPLWPEHLYVFSDVFGLQDCVLKQTSASLLKSLSESCGVPQGCVHRPLSSVYLSIISVHLFQVREFFHVMSVFKYAGSRHRMEKKSFHQVSLVKGTAVETCGICGFPQTPHLTVLGAFNGS